MSPSSNAPDARCPKCGGIFQDQNLCTFCASGLRYNGRGFAFKATEMRCPRCRTAPLFEIHYRDIDVDVCIECQGTWFDLGELEAMVNSARQDARGGIFEPDAGAPTHGVGPDPTEVAYVKCPKCEKLMNRTNFERRSGIIVDWCRQHGIWLDGGEIAQVRSWAASTPDGPPAPPPVSEPKTTPAGGLGASDWLDRPSSSWEARMQSRAAVVHGVGAFLHFLGDLFTR